jgi:phosphatidate cytidylyltransferase
MGCADGVPSLRPAEANPGSSPAGLGARLVSVIVLVPLFAWIVVLAPAWAFAILVVTAAAIAQWEFTRMFRRAGVPVFGRLGLVAGVLVTASFAAPAREATLPVLGAVVLGVLSAGLVGRAGGPPAWEPSAITLLGVLYVNWLLGHALWLRGHAAGVELILFLAWVTWLGESGAYLVGSRLGRWKLAPVVSPRKTVEGAAAQVAVSLLAALAGQPWLYPSLGLRSAMLLGLVLGVVGQVGDLVESLVKRSLGTKDAGGILPGHGGVLDRIDSLLFNTPVLYYCTVYTRAVPS